jgi:outer membrane protein TolC
MPFLPALLALALAASQDPATPAPAPVPPAAPPAQALQLTLEEAVDTALANDLSLRIAEVAGDIARYNFEGSWGTFDPELRAGAGFSNNQSLPIQTQGGTFTIEEKRIDASAGVLFPLTTGGSFDASISQGSSDINGQNPNPSILDTIGLAFRQPLMRGAGAKYATSEQHEFDLRYQQQIERVRQARQDLVRQVADAYWDLVAATDQLQVAEETLSLGRQQLEQNQRRLTAGVGTSVEVLQAEANVAERVGERLLRETAVRGAADRLKALLHPGTKVADWELEITPVTPLPTADAKLVSEWQPAMLRALDKRSELRQQRYEIDIGEEQLVRARSQRKPGLDLLLAGGSTGFEGSEYQAFVSAIELDTMRYNASLNFTFPIGNRTASNAEFAARAAVRSARLNYDLLESQVVADVREAVRNANYAVEAVRAAEVTVALARRQLEAEQARYREGLSTNYQVLEFQQKLAEALYTQTFAHTTFARSMTALLRAQGIIGEVRR